MSTRVITSLPGDLMEEIDQWRRFDRGIPPRAEAMRRLIGYGLRSARFLEKILLCVDATTVGGTDTAVASRLIRDEILFLLYDLEVEADDAHKVMEILLQKPDEPQVK